MTEIIVLDVVGPVCVDPEDGALLCQRSHTAFCNGPKVLFNFSGVQTLTSSFLNAALACMFATYSIDTIKERIGWTGLDPIDDNLMRLAFKNAVRFYSASPEQQKAINAISRRAIEE